MTVPLSAIFIGSDFACVCFGYLLVIYWPTHAGPEHQHPTHTSQLTELNMFSLLLVYFQKIVDWMVAVWNSRFCEAWE